MEATSNGWEDRQNTYRLLELTNYKVFETNLSQEDKFIIEDYNRQLAYRCRFVGNAYCIGYCIGKLTQNQLLDWYLKQDATFTTDVVKHISINLFLSSNFCGNTVDLNKIS